MIRTLALRIEDRRIAGHLTAVERLLRRRDTSDMPRTLQQRRTSMLDRLAEYTQQGVFPRNDTGSLATPVFVDANGRECAVGHLIGRDADLVTTISTSLALAGLRLTNLMSTLLVLVAFAPLVWVVVRRGSGRDRQTTSQSVEL